jgi:FAD/FMN-containing dehydrogenase
VRRRGAVGGRAGGVELYEPGALTIVVKAGTPLAEIEALLAKENQRLPFEPMDHRALLGTDGRADHRRRRGGQCLGSAAHPGRAPAATA